MIRIKLFVIFCLFGTFLGTSQEKIGVKKVTTVLEMIEVPSLASRRASLIPADVEPGEAKDGRSSKIETVIGKDPQKTMDPYAANRHILKNAIPSRMPNLVYDAAESASRPTDPAVAVGPNHAVYVFNSGIRIFDKLGNALTGQIAATNIFPPASLCCDLTVSHDPIANRFVMSVLYTNGTGRIAVSQGPDPVNDGWFVYQISITDYNKLSIWSDGYYLTQQSSSNMLQVLNRDQAIAGDPNAAIQIFDLPAFRRSGFASFQVANAGDSNFPPAGNATAVFYQDDGWASASVDGIRLWDINIDWVTPSNSVISSSNDITTTPFVSVFDGGSFANLDQANSTFDLDALQGIIMNQAQYRKFPTHNSMVFCFVIDVDPANERAGLRWYELRQTADGMPWTVHQEGTYERPGFHIWNGSMAMDKFGNIGMGYSIMEDDGTGFVDLAFTGRRSGDPLNTMTVAEQKFIEGTAPMPQGGGSEARYGDYSKIDVDPSDERSFYFVSEVFNSTRKNTVAVFDLGFEFDNDLGAVAISAPVAEGTFSATETLTAIIQSFSNTPQSNFPIAVYLDGVLQFTETFTGTIAPGDQLTYTFTNTLDLSTEGNSYEIKVETQLAGDEDNSNDAFTTNVKHQFANDIGVTAITSPVDGQGLTNEGVTVEITNFGTVAQSGFPVTFSLNGAVVATETFTGTVAPGATEPFTFTALANLSTAGAYTLLASTTLGIDSDNANDSFTTSVTNFACTNYANMTSMPVGPNQGTITESTINVGDSFVIDDMEVIIDVSHTWTGNLDMKLVLPDGSEVILAEDLGFNGDNYTNTTFDQEAANDITSGTPPFTGVFKPQGDLSLHYGKNSQGNYKLVIEDDANGQGGMLNSWSVNLCRALSTNEASLNKNALDIYSVSKNIFEIKLKNPKESKYELRVYDISGKVLKFKTLRPQGANLTERLDMSYAPAGTYLVQVGNAHKKILVK